MLFEAETKTAKDSTQTVFSRKDSLRIQAKADSLRRVELASKDSTARLKYDRFEQKEEPLTSFRDLHRSQLFLRATSNINRQVSMDSTGTKVIVEETIAGQKVKPKLEIPLDEYIELRLDAIKREAWEQKGYEYILKESKKDLSQLITDLTNIDIPLPSNPILSIFGPPKISLRINGQVDIHGAWRNESTEGITSSALGNTRNEPDFKQTVQINLSGTIGDKLNLSADWNTERQFQYENQLKIKYTGYEDEIVQSVEGGNVSLQTSPLVGGSEALFGIKAHFKMGPFSLTALASQKKSEVKEVSYSGGSQSKEITIHAYEYSTNHYFVDSIYQNKEVNVFNKYYGNATPIPTNYLRIKDIQVWKTTTGLFNPTERKANAYLHLPKREGALYPDSLRDSTKNSIPGLTEIDRRFVLLTEGTDYIIHPETGFISFKTQVQEQDAIAVSYYVEGFTNIKEDDVYYGEFTREAVSGSAKRLVLKLIRPSSLQPQFKDAWKLQLKNIYPMGGRRIKEEGFSMDIKKIVEGGEPQDNVNGTKLLQVFGFDQTDKSKTSTTPDGAFDFFADRTIMTETGEIIFPVLQPFGRDFPSTLPADLKFKAVYDTTNTFAQQDRAHDKFIMVCKYSADVSANINIGFNVVENSVRVLLNGSPLKEGVDYEVDYNSGQVLIRNDNALVPGADLKITSEQNDLFTLASKTMLGFRGLYEFNRETSLGFSFLNLNQQTLSDKVRIGEEPLNNSIFGVDFKTNINLPFITKALDKLISTSAPSSLTINAEAAYIDPDPNTKKSTISSDGGRSIAYVDDFEGAKRTIPLVEADASWRDLSIPNNLPQIGNLPETEQINYKAKTFWFNVRPSDVLIQDIYGDRKKAPPEARQITTLDFVYQPDKRGFYNYTPSLTDKSKNWGGIMKGLSSTANNLIEENIEFIEFWINVVDAPAGAKLHMDLGQISEDVIPNRKLDTEDKNDNDLVDDGEDIGIDATKNIEEPDYNSVTNSDPANDNFYFIYKPSGMIADDYSSYNGNEGNAVSTEMGRIPDTEDLNRNKTLDRTNSYFRYEVPLDTTAANPFRQGAGSNKGWFLFKIPLKDWVAKVGDPSFSVVETFRIWISGVQQRIHLRFAEMNLVGSQWQKVLNPPKVTADDSVLTISTVSIEDNLEYEKPPGVVRERDRTQPDYEIEKNEQSLSLILKELQDGDKREVVRYLARPLDVFNYKQMKLFLHGDMNNTNGSVSYYKDASDYASEIYLRFGSDTANYYEYRQPVKEWWNEVSIRFDSLTAIKQSRNDSLKTVEYLVPIENLPGRYYGIKGNPSLTKVSFFTIGIVNPSDKGTPEQPVSGSVWVNELRVLEAEQTPGWAYSANASLQLADLMRVNVNASQTNPYFHKISDRFGSREDNLNWGMSVDFDVLKLIPVNLSGSNLRVNYSRTENASNPLYLPGTDIKISEAQNAVRKKLTDLGYNELEIQSKVDSIKNVTQTVGVTEMWNVSNIRFKIPTEVWYIRDIFNNISLNFNYNKTFNRSPITKNSLSWVWNAGASYSVNFSRDLYFKPADIPIINYIFDIFGDYKDMKVYFTPQSFNTSFTLMRKRSYSQSRSNENNPDIQRDFSANRGAGINWTFTEGGLLNLGLAYNFDVQSTLAYLLVDNGIEKQEGQIWREIFTGAFFGKDFNYKQSFDLRSNPRIPTWFGLNNFINLNASYSASYQWQNNFQQKELGRSAGYSNRISAGMTIRLKSLFEPLFESKEEVKAAPVIQKQPEGGGTTGGRRSGGGRGAGRNIDQPARIVQSDSLQKPLAADSLGIVAVKDSIMKTDVDSSLVNDTMIDTIPKGPSVFARSLQILKLGIKYILFDYDQISINFSQNSTYSGGGLLGVGTGFNNFFGVKYNDDKGPSRMFMLGFSNDIGKRAPLGNLQDSYSHKNDIDLKTSKPLWEGAQVDIRWRVGWGINKTVTIQTDENGVPTISNQVSSGSIDRSFLSLPLPFLGTGIKKVHSLYADSSESLSDAFISGFETFSVIGKVPFLSTVLKYIPRPNWSFTWNGLEQLSIFKFAKRVSLNHSYDSNYSEGWRINPAGDQEVQTQKVDYAFNPLVGLTFNFDELFGGNFQSTVRYSTKTGYSLGVTTKNITQSFSQDINVSASYSKSGFSLPLFGIDLKNDIEISLSYTRGKTSSIIYEMDSFKEAGKPQEGKTNTTIEPKIRYVMSSRVTLSIFYRRTSIEPEGASRIPPTTTNEAGVDVRIAIQ
ncbi:MAG: cell surface protein SprA [Stygiobacter sp.]|nr:MAG: cell surface protein SprA [Stygiobacter sp.]